MNSHCTPQNGWPIKILASLILGSLGYCTRNWQWAVSVKHLSPSLTKDMRTWYKNAGPKSYGTSSTNAKPRLTSQVNGSYSSNGKETVTSWKSPPRRFFPIRTRSKINKGVNDGHTDDRESCYRWPRAMEWFPQHTHVFATLMCSLTISLECLRIHLRYFYINIQNSPKISTYSTTQQPPGSYCRPL